MVVDGDGEAGGVLEALRLSGGEMVVVLDSCGVVGGLGAVPCGGK